MVLALVRGDHRVNEIKLQNALGAPFRPARPEEVERIGPAGFIGPVGADVAILLDAAVAGREGEAGYVTGANRADAHLRGVLPGRDFTFEDVDIRRVEPGDRVDGGELRIETAIEVGNIFKLGTRYSKPLDATYLDESGREQPIWMGSYGIGPARIAAAAVEQFADDRGISWPRSLAPSCPTYSFTSRRCRRTWPAHRRTRFRVSRCRFASCVPSHVAAYESGRSTRSSHRRCSRIICRR